MALINTMEYNVKTKTITNNTREQTQEEIYQQALAQSQQAEEEQIESNRLTLQDKARNAITANKTYLASKPTTDEALAQVDALTRQVNSIIRLVIQKLDEVE